MRWTMQYMNPPKIEFKTYYIITSMYAHVYPHTPFFFRESFKEHLLPENRQKKPRIILCKRPLPCFFQDDFPLESAALS